MTYFIGSLSEYNYKGTLFTVGDEVRVLPSSPKFNEMSGVILKISHSNHGRGRIHALLDCDIVLPFYVPIGRLRKE